MSDLLKELIRTAPASPNGDAATAEALRHYLSERGVETRLDAVGDRDANLVARIPGRGERPSLIFACHLDVVPPGNESWDFDPFGGEESEGRILGRGATDMLGGVTAVAEAMARIRGEGRRLAGDLILVATAGEETDSRGATRYIEENLGRLGAIAGIVVPEPSALTVARAHRGILWIEVVTHGRTAHGSMPELGINAIEKMRDFLDLLRSYRVPCVIHPLLGGCSLSVNTLRAGEAVNQVPDLCSLCLDIRTLPGQGQTAVLKDIEAMIASLAKADCDFRAEVSILRSVAALETPAADPFVASVCAAIGAEGCTSLPFTTDGPIFAQLGAPVVILGPGDPAACHKPNEYLEISQLVAAREMYRSIALSLLLT